MSGKKQQRRHGRRFIQLWSNVKRSAAYHGLSLGARCALLELLDKYTGCNNGAILMGVRELAERLNCSKDSAANALHELDDARLAQPMVVGVWRGRKATTWRLTFYRCDSTGELPISNWTECILSPPTGTQDPHCVPQGGRKKSVSPPTGTQKPKSSMNGDSPSPPTGTHIYIYQGDSGTDARTAKARKRAGLDLKTPPDGGAT